MAQHHSAVAGCNAERFRLGTRATFGPRSTDSAPRTASRLPQHLQDAQQLAARGNAAPQPTATPSDSRRDARRAVLRARRTQVATRRRCAARLGRWLGCRRLGSSRARSLHFCQRRARRVRAARRQPPRGSSSTRGRALRRVVLRKGASRQRELATGWEAVERRIHAVERALLLLLRECERRILRRRRRGGTRARL